MPIRTPMEQQKQPQQQQKDVSERGTNCNEGKVSSHVPEEPHNPNLTKISTVHNQSDTNPKLSEAKKNPTDLTKEQPRAQLLEENRIPKAKQENINKYTSDQKIATDSPPESFKKQKKDDQKDGQQSNTVTATTMCCCCSIL
ncbi:uncharacterized protein LOC126733263 isoform X1 [Quercus robur]|uniref:uncharacterized protein LOC126733263 isoform X1 n=1 Tax=Quercus robur TaxID=38942 RepID=UPI002162E116|nr:uncharacterized protein LOC126733263 isoform X1 [Quercus robur]